MILEAGVLISFLVASVGVTLLPGPDNLFVLSLSTLHGARTGLPIALGMAAGNFVHTAAVALGFSALLMSSPIALSVIKVSGVFYLLYLSWQSWHHPLNLSAPQSGNESAGQSRISLFRRGVFMNVLNPKVILFFLAFFPQFVDQSSEHKVLQIFILGTVFVAQTAVVFGAIALTAGRLQPFIQKLTPRLVAGITSGLFAALSLILALANFS